MLASITQRMRRDVLRVSCFQACSIRSAGIGACLDRTLVLMLIACWVITFLLPVAPTVQTQQRMA